MNKKIKIRELASSFIFSCDEKNISKQLKMLEEAEYKVPKDIEIWEKFEFEPLENLMSYIDTLESIINKGINLKNDEKE